MADELFDPRIDAQISVIGAMLIDERCIPSVIQGMGEGDFLDPTCRATFRCIRELALAHKPIDPVTVLAAMGGGADRVAWLRDAMDMTPTAANVNAYMEICRAGALFARLRAGAGELMECSSLENQMAAIRKLAGMMSATSKMPHMTAAELASDFIDRMSAKRPDYLPWGIPTANRTVSAERGDLILLGGYPSAGKTLLSLQMALAQARKGYKVGYYTLETQISKMADRIFAHLAKVSMENLKRRTFGPNEWQTFAEASADFATKAPIEFIQAATSTVEDIAADAIGHGFEVIYIDYLQLIESDRKESSYERVSRVSRSLKLFAQANRVAVIALAQLSRPVATGTGGARKMIPPSMSSFRDSGQIEQDADAAFLLWAADSDDNSSRRVLKLGKNKEGQKFKIELDFSGATQTMTEIFEGRDPEHRPSDKGKKKPSEAMQEVETDECPFPEALPV